MEKVLSTKVYLIMLVNFYESFIRIQDLRNNKGIYHYPNGDKYVGEWKDDRFHGVGIYLFANGERYEGTLYEGAKDGKGKYYYVNGNIFNGEW